MRVHTGAEADRSARSLGALAYTVGNDVVFAAGRYDPLGSSGRALIAHELAHVAQHDGTAHAPNHLLAPGHSIAPAAARLERQAHLASGYHGRRVPPGWAWERSTTPFVGYARGSRARDDDSSIDVTYEGETRTINDLEQDPSLPGTVRVDIGALKLPAKKGPWRDRYNALARAGNLQAVVEVSSDPARSALWQKRAPTTELRRLWLVRAGWPTERANRWWNEAGGNLGRGEFNPTTQARRVQAQVDHIIELQLGGTNVPENLAPHDGPDNMDSGGQIFLQVAGWAKAVQRAARGVVPRMRTVILQFSSVVQPEAYGKSTRALRALPARGNRDAAIEARKGGAACALQVHFTAIRDSEAGTRPSADDRREADEARGPLTDYPIAAGPSTATLRVPRGRTEVEIENSDIEANAAARELITGVVLEKLHRATTPHQVIGWIGSQDHPVRSGTRLPIKMRGRAGQRLVFAVQRTGRLNLQGGVAAVDFLYDYLSHGRMDLRETEGGIEGVGQLIPSVPLLSRATIEVHLANGRLDGTLRADPSKLTLPRPMRITDAAVTVALAPALAVDGRIAFAVGDILDGDLTAGVDAGGMFARGRMRAHIPHLDRAEGAVEYRPAAGLTGFVVVTASGTGLVHHAEVRLDFGHAGLSASGSIDLMLHGADNTAHLEVQRHGDGLLYLGRAHLSVPGLHPIDIDISYDGEHISGTAHTTFTVLGANGDITLNYRDGHFTGDGHAELQRGRFAGRLDAHLDEHGHLSGRGQGSLTIRPGLVGTVGVELTPEQRLRVSGELRFPPYRLFERRGNSYQLFHQNLPPIPIFAIPLPPPLGSVGVVATIGGGMDADYYIGPGQILDMVIRAALDPLAEDTNLDVEASARLDIPLHAGLRLSARVGLGLSLVAGTATGGITVAAGLALDGAVGADTSIRYRGGIVVVDAHAGINVRPALTLSIDADLQVDSPVYSHTWPYQLAAYRYDTGLEFGMVVPLHYASNEPFRFPSVQDIRWTIPQIDVGALAERVGNRVREGMGF